MSCHTLRTGNFNTDFVLLNEFATWRLSDPHSLAYVALESKRGREMAERLRLDVTQPEAGCLGCHAPQAGMPSLRKENVDVLRKEGVGCESCHGASEHWFGPHSEETWRRAPKEKLKKQMYDVRNPALKAELCVSCHVGDPARGRIVTHAMFAAGHPPLPSIEVASFSEQMPYHWRTGKEVPFLDNLLKSGKPEDLKIAEQYGLTAPPSMQSRQVVASGLAGLARQLDVIAKRSQLDARDAAARWPERAMPVFKDIATLPDLWPQIAMAHSDCTSCHHELAHASWRQVRGFSGRPGRVPLPEWPFVLPRRTTNEPEWTKAFQKVMDACQQRPFGDPVLLGKSAQAAGDLVRARLAHPNAVDPKRLLSALGSLGDDEFPNFDSARQIIAALRVVRAEAAPGNAELGKSLDEWTAKLDLDSPEKKAARRAQQKLAIGILEKLGKKSLLTLPTDAAFLDAVDKHFRDGTWPDDPATLDALRRLLHALTEHGGTAMTTELSKDGAARRELEDASDARLRASLQKARDYDPREFKAYLKKLRGLLPTP